MSEILKVLLSEKGRDANRTLIFVGVIFCGYHIMQVRETVADLRTKIAVIESRVALVRPGPVSSLTTNGTPHEVYVSR